MTSARSQFAATDVFLGSHAVAMGHLTPTALRSARFVRLFRDVYIGAGIPIDHVTRCAAAALVMPADAVLTGRSAAAVLGKDVTRRHDPVEIVADESARFGPVRGLMIKRTSISAPDWRPGPFGRIATGPRMGFDLARGPVLKRSVAEVDAVVRAGLMNLDGLARYLRGRHEHGVGAARRVLELADARAESIPESEVRVTLVLGGIAVTPQVVIADERGFVCRADLGVDGYRVAVQYDGAWHALREQLAKDRVIANRVQEAGWRIVYLTAADNAQDPRALCDKVRRACASAPATSPLNGKNPPLEQRQAR